MYKEQVMHIRALQTRVGKTDIALSRVSQWANDIQYQQASKHPTLIHGAQVLTDRRNAQKKAVEAKAIREGSPSYTPPTTLSDTLNSTATQLKCATIPQLVKLKRELEAHIFEDITLPFYIRLQRQNAGISLKTVAATDGNTLRNNSYWSAETGETSVITRKHIEAYERAGVPIDWAYVERIRKRNLGNEVVIGRILRDERLYQGIELRELAESLGLYNPDLSNYELGYKRMPADVEKKYAAALGLTITKRMRAENNRYFEHRNRSASFSAQLKEFDAEHHPDTLTFGDFFRRARLENMLTLREMAAKIGRPFRQIWVIEKGLGGADPIILSLLCKTLNVVPPEDLLMQNDRQLEKDLEERKKRMARGIATRFTSLQAKQQASPLM